MDTGVAQGLYTGVNSGLYTGAGTGIDQGLNNGVLNELLIPNRIVRNGLVLYLDAANRYSYPGDGTAWTDLSGNSNNGTLNNGPTYSSINGGSIVFDGSNDYVNCGTGTPNTLQNSTIELFIKTGKISSKQSLMSTYEGTLGFGLEITSSNKFNFFGFTSSGVAQGVESNYIVSIGRLYHVIGIFTASTSFAIWVNGAFDISLSTAYSSIRRSAGTPVLLGCDSSSQNLYYGGNIYFARMYNRALTAWEVLQNYLATKQRFGL